MAEIITMPDQEPSNNVPNTNSEVLTAEIVPSQKILEFYNQLKQHNGVVITPYAKGKSIANDGLSAVVIGLSHYNRPIKAKLEIYPNPSRDGLTAYIHDTKGVFEEKTPEEAYAQFFTLINEEFYEVEKPDRDTDS